LTILDHYHCVVHIFMNVYVVEDDGGWSLVMKVI